MGNWTRNILGCVLLGAFPLLTHTLLALGHSMALAVGVSAVQVIIFGAILTARATYRHKWWIAAAAVALFLAVAYFSGQYGLFATAGVPYVVAYTGLLTLFGASLLPGREPLISGVARRIHGTLRPDIARYTRGVTIAWCCFFAFQLCVSLTLFLAAPLVMWSLYVNVLDLPLIALMFTGEYLYRIAHIPNRPNSTIPQIIRVFTQRNAPRAEPVNPNA
ncbi:MAG TPA: hypothetical protein VFC38_06505 [Stellaceae bacterium]|nr:hypothetical protein [Stellaceae bacterium]